MTPDHLIERATKRTRDLRRHTLRCWRMATAAVAVVIAGCGGSSGGDGGGNGSAPCGAPAGEWQYLSSCDGVFGGVVHQCQDTYATPSVAQAIQPEVAGLCSAESGKLLSTTCPTTGSLGSCVITASTGGLAELIRLYQYQQNGITVQSFEANCQQQHGTFILPNGTLATGGAPTNSANCGGQATNMMGTSSGVAFSVATSANGQVIECTNYVGAVTSQELQSLLATGATTSACPAQNAGCACPQAAGSGPFGTTPTLIYYKSSVDPTASICASMGTKCSATYTPP